MERTIHPPILPLVLPILIIIKKVEPFSFKFRYIGVTEGQILDQYGVIMTFLTFLLAFGLILENPPTVENGLTPSGKAKSLVFEENLRFGAEEEEDEYLWGSVNCDLAVDGRGHIFLADPKACEIYEFDTNGKYVRTLARKGAGPGELVAVARIQFLGDGRLAVFESAPGVQARVQIFNKDLAYEKTVQPASMSVIPISIEFNPEGSHFAGNVLNFDLQTGKMLNKSGLTRLEGYELIETFTSRQQNVDFAQLNSPQALGDMMGEMVNGFFKGNGVFTFDKDGNFYSGISNKYEIAIRGKDLKTVKKVIKRKHKPIMFTEKEHRAVAERLADNFRETPFGPMINDQFVEHVLRKSTPPEVKDPIEGMAVTPEGYLLVLHNLNRDNGDQVIDIFDQKGTYVGQTSMSGWAFVDQTSSWRMVFKGGQAYAVLSNEDDEIQVVRFKYALK